MKKQKRRKQSKLALINLAARTLRKGGVVAFPTETVYGLGANALDKTAVKKIFAAKGRPADNPLIVHISDRKMLDAIVQRVPKNVEPLLKAFWPGPLTILFKKNASVPDVVTASLPRVAVRMPKHPIALALINKAGVPIAAPSANRSGRTSPTSAAHVKEDFPGILVIDGGRTKHGIESTVIAVDGKPRVLRLGAITIEQLQKFLPDITIARGAKVESPGMKYRHYSPRVPLILFKDEKRLIRYAKHKKDSIILCIESKRKLFKDMNTISLGKSDEDVARNLFHVLRKQRTGVLLVLGVRKKGIGRAVMDRLERAATKTF